MVIFFKNGLNDFKIDIKLQRIIPYIVSLLNEDSALVRVTALRILTSVVHFFVNNLYFCYF